MTFGRGVYTMFNLSPGDLFVRVPTLSGESLLLEHYLERDLGFDY